MLQRKQLCERARSNVCERARSNVMRGKNVRRRRTDAEDQKQVSSTSATDDSVSLRDSSWMLGLKNLETKWQRYTISVVVKLQISRNRRGPCAGQGGPSARARGDQARGRGSGAGPGTGSDTSLRGSGAGPGDQAQAQEQRGSQTWTMRGQGGPSARARERRGTMHRQRRELAREQRGTRGPSTGTGATREPDVDHARPGGTKRAGRGSGGSSTGTMLSVRSGAQGPGANRRASRRGTRREQTREQTRELAREAREARGRGTGARGRGISSHLISIFISSTAGTVSIIQEGGTGGAG